MMRRHGRVSRARIAGTAVLGLLSAAGVSGCESADKEAATQAANVLIALRRRNVDIVNATVDQPSLDEVFLALTGQAPATPVLEPEASNA